MKSIATDKDLQAEEWKPAKPALILASLLSWLFHPLFISTYLTAFLLYIDPYAFAGINASGKMFVLVSVFFNTAFVPGFAVFLMYLLKLTRSMELHTQRDRIIPLALTMIFYFWTWYVRLNIPGTPILLKQLLMGAFLAVCITWMLNIFYKVSMHAVGAGGLLMFFLITSFTEEGSSGLYLSLAVLIAGLVTSARLLLRRHVPQEVYSGFMAGLICQLFAWAWYSFL